MTETVQIVQAVAGVCTAGIVALSAAVTAYLAYRVATLSSQVKVVGKDVAAVHTATNSMHDAIVKATGDAAFQAGKAAVLARPLVPRPPDHLGE